MKKIFYFIIQNFIFLFLIFSCSSIPTKVVLEEEIQETDYNAMVEIYNKPYRLNEKWFYPINTKNLSNHYFYETGFAEICTESFFGAKTIMGQNFDTIHLYVAHRVLPLKSSVLISNLLNGKALKAIINDRGPSNKARIACVNQKVIDILDVQDEKEIRIGIEYQVTNESFIASTVITPEEESYVPGTSSVEDVNIVSLDDGLPVDEETNKEIILITNDVVQPVDFVEINNNNDIYIEVTSFKNLDIAKDFKMKIGKMFGDISIRASKIKQDASYRILIGPFLEINECDVIYNEVLNNGYAGAKIIII